MNCRKVRALLPEFVDEESLSIGLEQRVRQHLTVCPDCARMASELRGTVGLLQGLPRLETSEEFLPNLRRHLPVAVALARRAPARTGWLAWLSNWLAWGQTRRALVLAPTALVLSLSVYLYSAKVPGRNAEAMISERAYLAEVAREHAGYAIEHPLSDPSAVSLALASNTKDH